MSLELYLNRVDSMADRLGKPIDLRIKRPVAIFLSKGFTTTASCQGHLHRGCPFPWIDFTASSRESLEDLLIKSEFSECFSMEWFGHNIFKEFRFRGKGCGLHCKNNCKNGFGPPGELGCRVTKESLVSDLRLMTSFSEWVLVNG